MRRLATRPWNSDRNGPGPALAARVAQIRPSSNDLEGESGAPSPLGGMIDGRTSSRSGSARPKFFVIGPRSKSRINGDRQGPVGLTKTITWFSPYRLQYR